MKLINLKQFFPQLRRAAPGIWIALACSSAGLSLGLVIIPLQQSIVTNVAIIQQSQHDVLLQDAGVRNLIAAKKRTDEIDQTLSKLQTSFVTARDPLPFINRLENLATTRNVTLALQIQEPALERDHTGMTAVETKLMITGDYVNVLEYINDVMAEPTYINITQLAIGEDSDAAGQTTATLQTLTYWR